MRPEWNHYDLPSLSRTLGSLSCPSGHHNTAFTGLYQSRSGDLKYARLFCNECSDNIYVDGSPYLWMPAPALPEKQKRQRRTTHLPTIGAEFCWICNWDAGTLSNFGMGIQYAHPIDRAAALDAGRNPMDDNTFPLCDYHHQAVDRERAQYAKLLDLYRLAGAVSGIAHPEVPKDLP